jgi:hypothetical protein
MKKILFLAAAVVLVAAACNSKQSASTTSTTATNQTQNSSSTQASDSADGATMQLNTKVDSEDTVNTQPNDDIVNSDNTIISNYDGVSNANTY